VLIAWTKQQLPVADKPCRDHNGLMYSTRPIGMTSSAPVGVGSLAFDQFCRQTARIKASKRQQLTWIKN
jgi:hypothetical protein